MARRGAESGGAACVRQIMSGRLWLWALVATLLALNLWRLTAGTHSNHSYVMPESERQKSADSYLSALPPEAMSALSRNSETVPSTLRSVPRVPVTAPLPVAVSPPWPAAAAAAAAPEVPPPPQPPAAAVAARLPAASTAVSMTAAQPCLPTSDCQCGVGSCAPISNSTYSFLYRTPKPPQLQFSPTAKSSVEVLFPGAKWENPNLLFRNVAIQGRSLLWLNGRPPKFDGFHVKGLRISQSETPKCSRTFMGPVFYFHYQTVVNHWHIHNDNLLPLYRMMHDAGFGLHDPSGQQPKTTVILAGSNERVDGAELPFFRWALSKMVDEVVTMSAVPAGSAWCMPLLRTGRPHRLFRVHPHHILYYEQQNMGLKFTELMRSRIPLQRSTAQWPPRVTFLQRNGNRHFVDPSYLQKAWTLMGVTMKVVVFSAATSSEEQCRIMSNTDILYAVHGGGNGNLWYLADNGVFVHILPNKLPQWELSIIRRHAQMRHIGYLSWRSAGKDEGTGWKPGKVHMRDDAYDANPLVIDVLLEYLRMNPHLKAQMNMQPQDILPQHQLSY